MVTAHCGYLDYNARAPLRPEAREAMQTAFEVCGNPSSVHRAGREARRLLESGRRAVADLLAVPPSAVVFTSGATESNATALRGLGGQARLLVSAVEHESVAAYPGVETIPVTADGVIDLAALHRLLTADPRPALVVVMAVNNETGVIQPLGDVAALARGHGALVHCDAVQAPGRVPLADIARAADSIALSAHKLGGPPGCGALVLREGLAPAPLLVGGGQERRRRPGTENLPGIAGFGAVCRAVLDDPAEPARVAVLRDRLEVTVRSACPEVRVYGSGAPRVGNTTCLGMPGVPSETQVMHFDLNGFAVSAGAACSSGKVQASRVLQAMGVEAAEAGEAIRVSLGWASCAADVDGFVQAWQALAARRRAGAAREPVAAAPEWPAAGLSTQ